MTQARLLGGRYQVGELLGYGGMAEVHRGRDLRLGRDVAIKMLRTDLARDDTFQLRFRREAQNAASLNHPAIVAVYDTGEERGSSGESLPYIVMEFVNGRTLKEVLQVEGRLMPRRALEITAEICAALEFSHRHSIIHRDIKPGNVMLTQTNQIKVMDFGIARALAASGSTMTQTSAVIGTAQYLSPEQARGESVDARSDVYATGCVLYELLTGQPPFMGDSPVSVAYQHVREDARPPSMLNRDVPPPVDAVVLKALAKNPHNRYQSAAEMRADMLRAVQGRPVHAEPVLIDEHGATRMMRPGSPGRPVPGRPGQRRKNTGWAVWGLIGLAAAAVITLIIGLIVSQQPRQITVPELIGETKPQADLLLQRNNLEALPTAINDPACPENVVLDQDPTPGTRVNVGSTIRYSWCAGAGQVTIPLDVIGKTREQAEVALEGLTPVFEDIDSAKPAGTVVRTDPEAGQVVAGGTTVTVFLSRGNFRVVPNLLNITQAQAEFLLQREGFTATPTVLFVTVTDPAQVGIVNFQNPSPETEWDPARSVTIRVGQAPAPPPSSDTSPSPPP
jgi:serine/threonine-protein kinase